MVRKGKTEIVFYLLVHFLNVHNSQAWVRLKQEPGTPLWSLTCMAKAQAFGPTSIAFPGALTGKLGWDWSNQNLKLAF